jgi:hypothetical protein
LRSGLIQSGSGFCTVLPSTWSAVRPSDGAARRNLRRFHRSWEKWNRLRGERLTAGDWCAFEAAYAAARPA